MASPQLEKGFVRIANELFERLYQSCLPGREHRAMEFILRVTYGYARKMAEVSSMELAHQLDCDSGDARRILTNLVNRNMLFRVREARGPKPAVYQINKNWEAWKHGRKSPWPPLQEKFTRGAYTTSNPFQETKNPTASSGEIPRLDVVPTPRQSVPNPTGSGQNLPESIATLETLKQEDMKTVNTTPLTPQGERGVSGRSRKAGAKNTNSPKNQNPNFLKMCSWLETKLGHPPADHLAQRTWAIVNRKTPAGWPPGTWRQNCVDTFERCLDGAIFDISAGKQIHSALAAANSRAEQAIAQEARTSEQ